MKKIIIFLLILVALYFVLKSEPVQDFLDDLGQSHQLNLSF